MLIQAFEVIDYEVVKDLDNELLNQLSELENNEAYLYQKLESNEDSSKDNWLV